MNIYGAIRRLTLMVLRDTSSGKLLTFETNQSTTYTADRTIQSPPQNADSILVSENASQSLTNKTINASSNTVTNVSLTTGVTGTLPVANGGTGRTAAILSMIQVDTGNGMGSTNTSVTRWTNNPTATGSDISYTDSATLGAKFTINTTGQYSCFLSKKTGSAGAGLLISVNQTTSLGANGASGFASGGSTNVPKIVAYCEIPTTANFIAISGCFNFTAGDEVRALCDNNTNGDSRQIFTIVRVG